MLSSSESYLRSKSAISIEEHREEGLSSEEQSMITFLIISSLWIPDGSKAISDTHNLNISLQVGDYTDPVTQKHICLVLRLHYCGDLLVRKLS